MPLRHTLLALVNSEPLHGYRLRQLAAEYSWIYPMKNASIYPALHSLAEDGFVSFETEIHDGRARKIYSITDAGRAELGRWLCEPPEQEVSFRDQLLLKVAMQSEETMRYASAWIATALEKLRQEVDQYDRELKATDELSRYSRLAMEYGVDMLRLRMRFLERVVEENGGEI